MAQSSLENLPDPSPYASGPPSMNEFQAGKGPADTRSPGSSTAIPLTGGGRDDPGQGMPYANESRVIATYEADQGSFEGDSANKEASGARFGNDPHFPDGDGNIAPYANNG